MFDNFTPQFEEVNSHLDSPNAIGEELMLLNKPLRKGQFGFDIFPKIYPSGLVMLNPRWTNETYNLFYSKYYDNLYRLDLKPDYGQEGVTLHMKEVWERVKKNISNLNHLKKVLDAGSGPGYGLNYLKNEISDLDIYSIEASPDACEILKNEVGSKIIDSDIDGKWHEKYENCFDLIIMRHVVEHLTHPIKSLKNLSKSLSNQGLIYIAVPDMMNPRIKLRDYNNWWEYWFRAVHPFYYNKQTLFKTLYMSGLFPVAYGEENEEIWCLVKKVEEEKFNFVNNYKEQKKLLLNLLP